MRFIQLVSQVRKTKEYSKDKKFFDALLPNGKMIKEALERAEYLGKSLEKRYEMKSEASRKISPPIKVEEPIKQQLVKPVQPISSPITNGIGDSGFEK